MTCYFPDGSKADNYLPCDSGAKQSHCCESDHYCYSNGLCFSQDSMTSYRGGCTDKTWDSQACSSLCLQYSTYSGVWPCGDADRNWACNPPDCTNSSLLFSMTPGVIMQNKALDKDLGISSTSGTTSATAAASATSKPTSASTTPNAAASPGSDISADASCPSHAGAMAGIGVGVGLPLLIALAAVTWFWLRERKKAQGFQAVSTGHDGSLDMPEANQPAVNGGNSYYEPKWMANQPGSLSTGAPEPRYSTGGTAYPSELPYNPAQGRTELDSTATRLRP